MGKKTKTKRGKKSEFDTLCTANAAWWRDPSSTSDKLHEYTRENILDCAFGSNRDTLMTCINQHCITLESQFSTCGLTKMGRHLYFAGNKTQTGPCPCLRHAHLSETDFTEMLECRAEECYTVERGYIELICRRDQMMKIMDFFRHDEEVIVLGFDGEHFIANDAVEDDEVPLTNVMLPSSRILTVTRFETYHVGMKLHTFKREHNIDDGNICSVSIISNCPCVDGKGFCNEFLHKLATYMPRYAR